MPYCQVGRRSFQRFSTYRGATAAGVFTNTVFGFLKVYVLLAVYRQRTTVGSFDAVDVVTFTFLSQGMLAAIGGFSDMGLAARIRTGDVVSDLYRPLHFQSYWLSQDAGRMAFQLLARGIPPVAIGALWFPIRLPASARTWAAFALSLALAGLVSFHLRFLLSLTGFWLLDNRGAWQVGGLVLTFFSGFVVPITFFPSWLATVARALPAASTLQLPAELFLGQHAGATAAVLAQQAVWAAALLALGEMVAGRAFRKVVVQGG